MNNEKPQSVIAALIGWAIGTVVMLWAGYGFITSLLLGLATGCPVAFFVYQPQVVAVAFAQAWKYVRSTRIPLPGLPTLPQLLTMAEIRESLDFWGRVTINVALVLLVGASWLSPLLLLPFVVPRDLPLVLIFGLLCLLGGVAGLIIMYTILFDDDDDDEKKLGFYIVTSREVKRMTLVALSPLGILNVPLGIVLEIVCLLRIGLVLMSEFVIDLVRTILQVVVMVCCDGRLIAMASVAISLIVGYQTQSVLMSLGALAASLTAMWLFHGSALQLKAQCFSFR